ncbi:MAG TPA: thioredoxin domain-containing protein [Cellulomonas sp.]
MPSNDPKSSKVARRDQAREQARQLREQQKKKERRNRIVAITGLVAAVVVLAVVAVTIVRQGSSSSTAVVSYTGDDADTITLSDVTGPSTANSTGGIPVGADSVAGDTAADGDVVVSIYLDYMCPYCGQFEEANDSELTALREEGGVIVEYHIISFLDDSSSGTEYSTRAGNAAAIVADQAPEDFSAFSSALFANQPDEGGTGLTDDEIADLALGVGVSQDVVDTFTETVSDTDGRLFAKWLAANTNYTSETLGGISTPTVLINGTAFSGDLYTAGDLTDAIEAAKG